MRVVVVSSFQAGSQFANAINTVKMAEGFASAGFEVFLLCLRPEHTEVRPSHLDKIYGIHHQFHWVFIPVKEKQQKLFALLCLLHAVLYRPRYIYTRNYLFPVVSSRFGFTTFGETHAHVGYRGKDMLAMMRGTQYKAFEVLVTISPVLSEYFQSLGVPKEKILVLPDAVDLALFSRPNTLPASPYTTGKPNVTYAGHLYDYKGIPTVLAAARLLPDVNFHFVGGWDEDIRRHQQAAHQMSLNNVVFHGMKNLNEVPNYLWHADLLLLPPSANHPSAQWTSPLKLGEYLASGTPVTASAIPALKRLVSENQVCFFEPDNPESLAQAVIRVLGDKNYAQMLVQNGALQAKEWSYGKRVQKILQKAKED